VLEALASGVPAVVTESGGPRFIIREEETGFVARDLREFVSCIRSLAAQPGLLQTMRTSARSHALKASWDAVFESVYLTYERNLKSCSAAGKRIRMRPHTVLS
jgi:phosphatidylinositol alpha 1,6-mannosyltransferase